MLRSNRKEKQSREDELLDLQLRGERMRIKQMEKDNKSEKMHKVTSAIKRSGIFALKAVTPTKSISNQEASKRMLSIPNEMLDTHKEMFDASKAFGNHSSNRGKKIYYRRVR